MAKKNVGYLLPVEATAVSAPQTFPGFPGRFMPGEPLALANMGISEDEADAAIAEMGLPLQKLDLSAAQARAAFDPGDHFVPSEEAPEAAAFEEAPVAPEEGGEN